MIGVIANPADHNVVREFFELFKTPWEFYRRGAKYDVLLCAGDPVFADGDAAKLVLSYAGRKLEADEERGIDVQHHSSGGAILSFHESRIPIYGESVSFLAKGTTVLRDEQSQECAASIVQSGDRALARIGYDLFAEIRTVLTSGQPPKYAAIPTLELHIDLLRSLIINCGIPLVEIPAVPDGYRLIACLTHDIDHPSLRQHRWDHTMWGFLYRATLGSFVNVMRGRMSLHNFFTNYVAALKLPLILSGLAKDPWMDFANRYLEIEESVPSTFFVIPFKNCAGAASNGPAPARRGARYAAQDIASTIGKLLAAGCEVGLHGIDAWLDSSAGRKELEQVRRLTGKAEIGVRMHWLYYGQQSPQILESVGAAYDSTMGYNETVGYRAGTTQVYKPLGAQRLLELPLHVMDTALFYPGYLDLSPAAARTVLLRMMDDAVQYGGCLTVNWHDRSPAPERLWGASYLDLLQDLRFRGAWFATASEAVSWFKKRRAAMFEEDPAERGSIRIRVSSDCRCGLPGLRLRTYNIQESSQTEGSSGDPIIVAIAEDMRNYLPLPAN